MDKKVFDKLIVTAKKYYDKAQVAEGELFAYLEQELQNVDLEGIPSKAENADNVKDAISCYLHYDEYSPLQIWNELKVK
jgi:hypothetical protein